VLSEPINLTRNPWLIGQGFNALRVCLEMGMPSHFEKEEVAWIETALWTRQDWHCNSER